MSLLSDFTRKFFDELIKLKDVNIASPQDGEALTYDSGTQTWINSVVSGGGGGGGHTIQDEGTPLTQRTNLNFVGDGVTATDDVGNDATVVTIEKDATSSMIVNRLYESVTTVKDTFNITYSIINSVAYVDVWLNGIKLAPSEFTATNGSTVVLNSPIDGTVTPQEVEILAGFASGATDIAVSITRTVYTYTANDGQTEFEASYDIIDDIDFFIEGHRLHKEDYTASTGSTIVLNSPALLGEKVDIVVYKGVAGPIYPTDGLIREHLGDLSGNMLIDTVGNYSTPVTGTAANVAGKIDDAVSFNGVSYYYTGSDKSELELFRYSISAWIYPTSSANSIIYCSWASNATLYGIQFGISAGDFYINHGTGASNTFFSTTPIALNVWQHVVISYDNSSNITFYINGSVDNTGSVAAPAYPSNVLIFNIVGAYYNSGFTNIYTGYLDQFRLYNRSLSALEVSQLYNSGNGI